MKSKKNYIKPIHPGEILKEEFLKPLKITQYRLAKETKVPPIRISYIIKGKRSITADTALRLSAFFGNSEEFWMNLQMNYDMAYARQHYGAKIKKQIRPWESNIEKQD